MEKNIMRNYFFDILQLIAGLLSFVGYFPQLYKTFKTKSVKDFNLKTYISALIALIFMEGYAINSVYNGCSVMLIVTTTASLLLTLAMVIMIIKYREKKE
jgi:MtN3 and saliva related transmembrane protein